MHSLVTARLILRPLQLSDALEVTRLASDKEVAATTLNIPHPYPEGAAEGWINRTHELRENEAGYTFALARPQENLFMGAISMRISREHRAGELGYWLGVPYWSQGFMTEAARRIIQFGFEDLDLNRVYAAYLTHNIGSRRVMEKSGMVYEATLRQHVQKWGVYYDLGYCAILRQDYEPGG